MKPEDFDRIPRRDDLQRVPKPVEGEDGLFIVDASWGKIAPIELHPGVRTVGELETIAHLRAGGRAVDTRRENYVASGILAGAVPIVHEEIVARREDWDNGGVVLLYCNGPQCTATPLAIEALLAAGFPPERMLYYRGGIHDWVTLGLPLVAPEATG